MDPLRGYLFVEREATQEHGIRCLREAREREGKVTQKSAAAAAAAEQRARRLFSKGGAFVCLSAAILPV